jgi:hypothetical protein
VEPADEVAGCTIDGCPEAVGVAAVVVGEPVIEVEVVGREPAQHHPFGLEVHVHDPSFAAR